MQFPLVLIAAVATAAQAANDDVGNWLKKQVPFSSDRIMAHISEQGALVAGIGAGYPYSDYYDPYKFFWLRDGGISMMALADHYAKTGDKAIAEKMDLCYKWALKVQENGRRNGKPYPENMAWTRFDLNQGMPDEKWMSPQYDGLAFRALAFIQYGTSTQKLSTYFAGADSVIRSDLDAIVSTWNRRYQGLTQGYEPWEEIQGEHFVVRLVHHEALVKGAAVARSLGNNERADVYTNTAADIVKSLDKFWNGEWIKATVEAGPIYGDNDGSKTKKNTDKFIDIANIIGLIFNTNISPDYSITSVKSQAAAWSLIDTFKNGAHRPQIVLSDWALNKNECTSDGKPLAPGIGRYPEDIFDGPGYRYEDDSLHKKSHGAGFWFFAGNYLAEYCYKSVSEYEKIGRIEINNVNAKFWSFVGVNGGSIDRATKPAEFKKALELLYLKGDQFLRRTMQHVPQSGPEAGFMSEQFHGTTGAQMSTADLCWSYASVITAGNARESALAAIGSQPASPSCAPSAPIPVCRIPGGYLASRPRCNAKTAGECGAAGCCWVHTAAPYCVVADSAPPSSTTITEPIATATVTGTPVTTAVPTATPVPGSCPLPGTFTDKKDCGFAGITADGCVSKGCCWEPLQNNPNNLPWCFTKPTKPVACPAPGTISASSKKDCGFAGMNSQQCADKGCCWEAVSPNPQNQPWCFSL